MLNPNPPDSPPIPVAMLVFPETTASVVYGMYDMFMSAGRDWSVILDGRPGPQRMQPMLVSARPGPVAVGNDVSIAVHATFADCPPVEIICVPEMNLPPGEPLGDRFKAEIDWLHRAPRAGRHSRQRLLGRHAAGRGRTARRARCHHPLGMVRRCCASSTRR